MTGQTISHYKITAKLGEGGMGVVYKAEDINLGRLAALKFLLPHLVADQESRQRFLREAQAAAVLNHPNVCTVYEIEGGGANPFIAMEFVDGPSVAEKIKPPDDPVRPLPLEEAIDVAVQTASGLQAAHENGVFHRDVKCANILVTRTGQVKITDFGLAYLAERSRLTRSGTTLGTPAFMSPEQVLGKPTDRRTDIWSLGVVLYEMLTGRLPFDGEFEQAVKYSIVSEEHKPVTSLRVGLPLELDRIIAKALAKEPAERYQHVDDLATDLRAVQRGLGKSGTAKTRRPEDSGKPPRPRRNWKSYAPWAAAAILAAALLFRGEPPRQPPPRQSNFVIPIPADQQLPSVDDYPFDVSPDGAKLGYTAESGVITRLYVRPLDEFEAVAIPGTEGAHYPFFSPDGRQVGFFAENQLLKVSLSGGAPTPICRTDGRIFGASWGPDGTIIYGSSLGLRQVSENGGASKAVETGTPEGVACHWPSYLPDGKTILFSSGTLGSTAAELHTLSLAGGERRLVTHGYQGHYLPDGRIVFAHSGGLYSIRFDLGHLETRGGAESVLDDVAESRSTAAVYFRLTNDGALYYVPGPNDHSLVKADRAGRMTPLTERRGGYRQPAVSPNGRRIATVIDPPDEGKSDIWLLDLDHGSFTRITKEGHNLHPCWTPDGKRLVWARGGGNPGDMMWRAVDSLDAPAILLSGPNYHPPLLVSPDNQYVVFMERVPAAERNWELWAYPLSGQGDAFPLVESPFNELSAGVSPNSRWLAYQSDESGRPEIYVRGFPKGARRWTISTNGGFSPRWSRDGTELFYMEGRRMMAVPVNTKGEFSAGKADLLFEWRDMLAGEPDYDVLDDGFVMVRRNPHSLLSEIRVIENWTATLDSAVR